MFLQPPGFREELPTRAGTDSSVLLPYGSYELLPASLEFLLESEPLIRPKQIVSERWGVPKVRVVKTFAFPNCREVLCSHCGHLIDPVGPGTDSLGCSSEEGRGTSHIE